MSYIDFIGKVVVVVVYCLALYIYIGKELQGVDVLHKFTWIRLISRYK